MLPMDRGDRTPIAPHMIAREVTPASSTGKPFALLAVLLASMLSSGWVPSAQADPIAMPSGSTVWMHMEAGACPDADGDDCIGSNQPGAAPPNGIPLTTFEGTTGSDVGRYATGYAEVLPDRVRTLLRASNTSFMRASFQDTYTVHGTPEGLFQITATLSASGTARSVFKGGVVGYQLYAGSIGLEIGTFSTSDVAMQEQFRVTPFDPSSWVTLDLANSPQSPTPVVLPFNVGTASHALNVGVGDVFNLAYGINSGLFAGEIDLTAGGALISFALPEGVYLTSELGGVWGSVVPEPATFVLWAIGLCAVARRVRRGSVLRPDRS